MVYRRDTVNQDWMRDDDVVTVQCPIKFKPSQVLAADWPEKRAAMLENARLALAFLLDVKEQELTQR